MKTLIIDNYDSFTYNLFHLFGSVTGCEPTVIKNDDPQWHMDQLNAFDNVVISPGPGSPMVETDMGISRQILRQNSIIKPLLGICLGHQGLCYEMGAQVGKAPEAVHGRVFQVSHNTHPLFKDIPESFDVVRYHSLAVTNLTDALNSIAWTDDGILMAVAHKHLPYWGCQFHPESACSQYGKQLVQNFCDLSAQYNRKFSTHAKKTIKKPLKTDSISVANIPAPESIAYDLHVELLDINLPTEDVFSCLYANSKRSFWLDSNDPNSKTSKYSVMGDNNGLHARFVTVDTLRQQIIIGSYTGEKQQEETAFFEWLKQDLASLSIDDCNLPFDVRPGWFGHLGYELKYETGGNRVHAAELPDSAMLFADRILVHDHSNAQYYALALIEKQNEKSRESVIEWGNSINAKLQSCQVDNSLDQFSCPQGCELELRHTPQQYINAIKACQEEILQGESYEICLTNEIRFRLQDTPDHFTLYKYLRQLNPTPFSAFIRWPEWSVLSFSPERFISIDKQRTVESRPIKGTRKRLSDTVEDTLIKQDLASNIKDKAENMMIVDLVRNDLGQSSTLCGVKTGPLFEVESFATVHQLVSTIRSSLKPETSIVDCVKSCFPGGSMTGAPKIRTLSIIDRLEKGPRGIYSGSIGYFSVNQAADFNIVIRTLVLQKDLASIGTGGAIIGLSDPVSEVEETAIKSRALLEPFGLKFPDIPASPKPETSHDNNVCHTGEEVLLVDDELENMLKQYLSISEKGLPTQIMMIKDEMGHPEHCPIEILGVKHGLVLHCHGYQVNHADRASVLIINTEQQTELMIKGSLSPVTSLEADAVFSTLSRTQQLRICMIFRIDQNESISMQDIVERYDGQVVPRPENFLVFRIQPDYWQVTDKSERHVHKKHIAKKISHAQNWTRYTEQQDIVSTIHS